jgi:predicted NBD/HSP70 family sugar kinase
MYYICVTCVRFQQSYTRGGAGGRAQSAPLAGELLALIRAGASTRADLARLSGLSRPTVAARVQALIEAGLVVTGEGRIRRGRPPETLAFNAAGGYVLAADVGGTHTRVAITDLAANVLDETEADLDVSRGPEAVLGWVDEAFDGLLRRRGARVQDVRGIGVGVPGPVESPAGRLVHPPIMRGWHGVVVPEHFARYDAPVVVDRDANIIALGEHRRCWRGHPDVVVAKLGLGIGLGIIADGNLYRGALGAAGELGHQPRGGDQTCRCGKVGCLEAVAGGWAIIRELRATGRDVHTSADIVTLIRKGDDQAWRLVVEAGRLIGEALADVVALLNPSVLVVGGNLAGAQESLLPVIREAVYRRSQPLTSRDLLIAPTQLCASAGTIGAATLVHEHLYAPGRVSEQLGL